MAGQRERAKIAAALKEAERKQLREQALTRYARCSPTTGKPRLCDALLRADGVPSHKPKVIFNSVEDARAFAELLFALDGTVQVAYECKSSRHGHAHLASEAGDR